MSQINVTKQTAVVRIGPGATSSVSKVVMYARLIPGDGEITTSRQGHMYALKFRRG